jgi:hypothetical protein
MSTNDPKLPMVNGRYRPIQSGTGALREDFCLRAVDERKPGAPFASDLGAHSLRLGCVTEGPADKDVPLGEDAGIKGASQRADGRAVRPEPILMRAVFANATAKGAM